MAALKQLHMLTGDTRSSTLRRSTDAKSASARDEGTLKQGVILSSITIGRYGHESITNDFAGWVEPADKSWILYLDATGKPAAFYAEREPSGAVIGDGVVF